MKEETSIDSFLKNSTTPLVSVILPVKDGSKTIRRAIQSIFNQSYNNLELIIVDDHSTDNTVDIVNAIIDVRIKLVDSQNPGIANALNAGINRASGKYIARMDADDISYPDRIQKQVRFLQENPLVGVVSCLVKHIGSGRVMQKGYRIHTEWINSIIDPKNHYLNRFVDAPVAHPSVIFRRELIKKFGCYSVDMVPEDFELWLRWMDKGVRFAKIPDVLFDWYDSTKRASRVLEEYKQEQFDKVKTKYFAKWWQRKNSNKSIWIWGYGKKVFKKSATLQDFGIEIAGYIDIIDRPHSLRKVEHYSKIPGLDAFCLVYVSDRSGKVKITDYFKNMDMKPGKDFLYMT